MYPRLQKRRLVKLNRYRRSEDYDALLSDAKGIPFWVECDKERHEKLRKEHELDRGNSNCCFWDLLGRPVKHNEEKPLFDYEQIIIAALEYFLKIRIKKFRGGGMTEELLRWPAWLSLSNNRFRKRKAFIITGITQELANDHILRLKDMFSQYYPGAIDSMDYTTKTLTLNESLFRAYPQANPEAPRGKTDVFYILADEFDFPTRRVQDGMMSVITPFRPKSDTLIALNSTTKRLEGLYRELDDEWDRFLGTLGLIKPNINQYDLLLDQKPQYIQTIREKVKHRYFLLEFDYNWGLGKIYTEAEIDEVKEDPTFAGEFCLMYGGTVGNFFKPKDVDACTVDDYNPNIPNREAITILGVDPGYSDDSFFAIVIASYFNYRLNIMYANQFLKPQMTDMRDLICDLRLKYYVDKILCDGSDPSIIYALKEKLKEYPIDYHTVDESEYKRMIVEPVPFTKKQYEFLVHDKEVIEGRSLAIHKDFIYLINGFKAVYVENKKYDKDKSSNNDLVDATSMILSRFNFKSVNIISR